MIRITVGTLTVAGSDRTEFAFALSQVATVAALAKEHGATVAPRMAAINTASGADYCAQWLASPLNVGTGNKGPASRFRMSPDELSTYGENGRQEAAKARLIAGGESVEDSSGAGGGALQGARVEDAEENAALVAEFES